jgi:hypothetical protein
MGMLASTADNDTNAALLQAAMDCGGLKNKLAEDSKELQLAPGQSPCA